MKKIKLSIILTILIFLLFTPALCRAMPPGTLLYRTSSNNKIFGQGSDPLIYAERGIIKDVNSGHVGIYIGQEHGEDYIVEALSNGIVKTPAKYFVNLAQGEVFLGAKIPRQVSALQIAKVVAIAKSLVGKKLAYDLDFKNQKGPGSGDWTCVGLSEKLYESANIFNPNNLGALEYDPDYYAVNITPDGFDNYSIVNAQGDAFSRDKEFSKIARRPNLLLPAPELIGFDLGLEYNGERYIFLPYTQFLQTSLKDVLVDIPLSSSFPDQEVRGAINTTKLILRWSLINNPLSSVKNLAQRTFQTVQKIASAATTGIKKFTQNLFVSDSLAEVILDDKSIRAPAVNKLAKNKKKNSKKSRKSSTISKKNRSSQATKNHQGPGGLNPWPAIKVNYSINPSHSSKTNLALLSLKSPQQTKSETSSVSNPASISGSSPKETLVSPPPPTIKVNSANGDDSTIVSGSAVASPPSIIYYLPASNSTSVSGNSSVETGNSDSPSDNWPKLAKINKISATANNDFVELINLTDHDFDLAAAHYRLEKTKNAENPSIMMRIGNPADGAYPGGTIIKAHGRYLIVRVGASDYYQDQADALATRKEFSWTGSAYTIYLGVGAISSSADVDIVDALGFGGAHYFQGTEPALKITDNYLLSRITDTGNNYQDFSLIVAPDPEAVAARLALEIANSAEELATSTDELATTTEQVATNTAEVASSSDVVATSTDELINGTDDELATTSTDLATTTNEVASTSIEIATSTDEIASSSDLVATSTDEIASSSDLVATSTNELATSSETVLFNVPILINQIYSTFSNDYLELFNPTDQDFDLASSSYRLVKTKTALAPSLLMRFGNPDDGIYPGGTVIKAHSKYLIVRNDADNYYQNQADALALREEFTWADSGYTFYLGNGPISSSTDNNIIDVVGFGPEASYWRGSAPAPAIPDGQILNRVANNQDNASDFNLILSAGPDILPLPTTTSNLDLFVPLPPLVSSGLTQVWHFDQCSGPGHWVVGKWDCAQELSYNYDSLNFPLTPPVNANNFSVSFYYRGPSQFSRIRLSLSNSADDHLTLILESGLITIEGLPNSEWRYYLPEVPFDNVWHRATLVVNQAADYWAVYIDGQETIRQIFFAGLPIFSDLELSDDNGPALIDELAIWNRALHSDEILNNYLVASPYNPIDLRPAQIPAQLLYSWNFEEDYGPLAVDSLASTTLEVDPNLWTGRQHDNYALGLNLGKNYTVDFGSELVSQDLSLTFWWRNLSYPNGGRTNIYLQGGDNSDTNILALLVDYYRLGYWFNGQYGILAEGVNKALPNDDAWHHLALVYDSYRYQLNFYVDGELQVSMPLVRLSEGEGVKRLVINDDNFETAIDDLNIYAGALSPAQVQRLYLDSQ